MSPSTATTATTSTVATDATDALLVKAGLDGSADDQSKFLRALVESLQHAMPGTPLLVQAVLSTTQEAFCAYLHLDAQVAHEKSAVMLLQSALQAKWPQLTNLQVSRLEKVFSIGGASAGSRAVFHYIVEMDPEAGWMPELSSWYDTEHMPGLATVPGCVRAARYLNHDHGPLSLACYDLMTEETLGSVPWLAVRGTEWSSRMRPRFTNTRRSMFSYL